MKWQPIETAPEYVPILVTDGYVIVVVSRRSSSSYNWMKPVGFNGLEWGWNFRWEDLTHWMPLPPPPEEERS